MQQASHYPSSFPIDALPDELKAAVLEVHQYIQAPIPLIVAAALAPLSVAAQGLYNVRRLAGLDSPVSLYQLVIAASGERKSTADTLFRQPLTDFEKSHEEDALKALAAYRPLHRAWKSKLKGLDKAIERASAKDEPTVELTRAMQELAAAEPQKPLQAPVLVHCDITTEAFKLKLHENLPSAALSSSEAGLIMGGRATSEVAFYNQVWDGVDKVTVTRKSGDFTISNPRLTISLMAQPGIARRFFDKKGNQVRDIGLLARMLIAFPETTQGKRFNLSTEAPPWNALLKYHNRISALLQTYYDNYKTGKPKTTLQFTFQADQTCLRFYNAVETQLGEGRMLEDVRDHASKITENLARVAALLHIYQTNEGDIDVDTAERAAMICQWYALEFFRLFGAPNEMSQQHEFANRLIADLIRFNQQANGAWHFPKSHLYQYCHPSLRDKKNLLPALQALINHGLIYVVKGGDKKTHICLTQQFFQNHPAAFLSRQGAGQLVGTLVPHVGIEHALVMPGTVSFKYAPHPYSTSQDNSNPLDTKLL